MKNTKETIIEDVNLIQQFKESSEYNTYKQSIQFDFNEEFVIEDNLEIECQRLLFRFLSWCTQWFNGF